MKKTRKNEKLKKIPKGILLVLLFFISVGTLFSQTKDVQGVVLEASTKEPLIGVSVYVKENTSKATITDFDGNFTLKGVNPNSTIVISYVGFQKQEILFKNQARLDVLLEEESTLLNEVQVVAYGAQKKVSITGALSSMTGEELLKAPTGSITNALSGKLPGVSSVQYSGEPGADAAELYVRGLATYTGDTSPLIQVDGVERDFSQIDPNEIENITILKDASATAVFGVRGANGVILITTKRGSEGRAKISVSTSVGAVVPSRLLEFANSYQYASYYNEAQRNDGVVDSELKFRPEVLQALKDGSNPIVYPDMDWMDYLLKSNSIQSQHNVNISGGVDKLRYFVSVGMFTQSGLFKTFEAGHNFNFDYKRYNYRANLDFDVTSTTTLSMNIGGRVEDKNTPISREDNNQLFRHIYWATPFAGAGIVDGKWIQTNPDYIANPGDDGLVPYYGRGYQARSNNVLNVDLMLKQNLDMLTKGLSFGIKGSYNSTFSQTKSRTSSIAYYNPVLHADGSGNFDLRKNGDDGQLSYGEWYGKARDWYFETSFNYNRTFGGHTVGGLVLYNQSKEYYPSQYKDLPRGYVGLVARATYDYQNRYMAEFNFGYNGSENFHPDRRFGSFPAGSVGWVLTEETFMKDIKEYFSFIKLRASWGKVGNDKIGSDRFAYIDPTYVLGGSGYNFGTNVSSKQPGAYEGALTNPLLTWETAFKQNYGLDLYTLSDRLKLTFDFFTEKRKDILDNAKTIPSIIGIGSLPKLNLGRMENRGYEITLGWTDKLQSGLRYWVQGNMSFSRNKITEMDEVRQNEEYLYRTGRPAGRTLMKKFWGFYDETSNERYKAEFGQDIAEHPGGNLKPGDVVFVDLNKDGVIDDDDKMFQGYSNVPEGVAGLTMGLEWNGFDFNMQWTGAWNTSRILSDVLADPLGDTNMKSLLLYFYEDRWTEDNPSAAKWPRPSISDKKKNFSTSDLVLRDASYLRLKSIELGYTIPTAISKKVGMASVRVYMNGYNLLTFDKLKITDPESRTSDRPNYPLTKVFNLGLKIGF